MKCIIDIDGNQQELDVFSYYIAQSMYEGVDVVFSIITEQAKEDAFNVSENINKPSLAGIVEEDNFSVQGKTLDSLQSEDILKQLALLRDEKELKILNRLVSAEKLDVVEGTIKVTSSAIDEDEKDFINKLLKDLVDKEGELVTKALKELKGVMKTVVEKELYLVQENYPYFEESAESKSTGKKKVCLKGVINICSKLEEKR